MAGNRRLRVGADGPPGMDRNCVLSTRADAGSRTWMSASGAMFSPYIFFTLPSGRLSLGHFLSAKCASWGHVLAQE